MGCCDADHAAPIPDGLTSDEYAIRTNRGINAVSGRFTELRKAGLILVRDRVSAENVERLGIDRDRIALAADADEATLSGAFSLSTPLAPAWRRDCPNGSWLSDLG